MAPLGETIADEELRCTLDLTRSKLHLNRLKHDPPAAGHSAADKSGQSGVLPLGGTHALSRTFDFTGMRTESENVVPAMTDSTVESLTQVDI